MASLAQDLEFWMTRLPPRLKSTPIIQLAIPGSHDSTTHLLTKKSDVAPDADPIIRFLKFLKPILGPVVCRWSKTQAVDLKTQLQNGIRYFDLRIATKKTTSQFYFVHKLYAECVDCVLEQIKCFLDAHPEEIVILDCQHFYDLSAKDHERFIAFLVATFGPKLLPCGESMTHLTLDHITKKCKSQVILIYRNKQMSRQFLWPSACFPTPWPNTTSISYLLSFLSRGLTHRNFSVGFISQCVLTPTVWYAFTNLFSSLKNKCALPLAPEKHNWLKRQSPGKGGINIVICDFVDYQAYQFCKEVVNLNLKLLETTDEEFPVTD